MTHYKVLIMIGAKDHAAPLVYAIEFDSEKAADGAAEFFAAGQFAVIVLKDSEDDDESLSAELATTAA
jgi:hypothetical protein